MNTDLIRKANALLREAYASEPKPVIKNPSDCVALPTIRRQSCAETERFTVLTLNGAHEVIRVHVVTKGLVNRTLAHPREVFRPAIKDNAVAIVVVHNHPSGNLIASDDDKELTKRLMDAGEIIGINVLDHVIVSRRGYLSMASAGLINPQSEAE